jgi:hypothetical protein
MTDIISSNARPDGAAGDAWEQLSSVVIDGESIVVYALQHRLHALVRRRSVAAATTGRFIFITRKLLGGYEPIDIRWQDLKDVRLVVGMFSANLILEFNSNLSDTAMGEGRPTVLRIIGLRTEPAQALYRECQTQGQIWREKRRVRSIEEMRAHAGGVQIATGLYPSSAPQDATGVGAARLSDGVEDAPARLARAKDMLDRGLITDADFQAIKAKIIASL